jgi:putative tryptophan/tyrosine transport system substrate-binding protein
MKSCWHPAIMAAAIALGSSAALAQPWPSKPIRAFIPFAAGSATDIVPRALFEPLGPELFHKGLSEMGYAEGRNVAVEYRYADGQYDRLPALAADLANRRVAVIVATAGTPTIRAAKAATSTIPIVFVIGGDPVMFGIVASLSRPGGNITGVTLLGTAELAAKRLGLLLELVPAAAAIGVLANPTNPISKPQLTELETAIRSLGRQIHILNASSERDFETAFTAINQQHIDALIVAADPFFDDRRTQLVALWPLEASGQQAMPVIGLLSSRVGADSAYLVTAFREGLKQSGYVEGQKSRSNIAGRRVALINCRPWPKI